MLVLFIFVCLTVSASAETEINFNFSSSPNNRSLLGSTCGGNGGCDSDAKAGIVAMTRNVYLGASLEQLLNPNLQQLSGSVSALLSQSVGAGDPRLTSNPRLRMRVIASEIASSRAHVVALQEVAEWTLNALHIDYLDMILERLTELDLTYVVASRAQGVIVGPVTLPSNTVTLALSDVLLVRGDVAFSRPARHAYSSVFVPSSIVGSIPRQFVSVDLNVDGKSMRVFGTHLEVGDSAVREAQAKELLSHIKSSPGTAVLVLGTWNSERGVPGDAHAIFTIQGGLLDAWSAAGIGAGYTFGHDELLADVSQTTSKRIDFIAGSSVTFKDAALVDSEIDSADRPLWPSNHVGVVTRVIL